jgi:hypothetical protein
VFLERDCFAQTKSLRPGWIRSCAVSHWLAQLRRYRRICSVNPRKILSESGDRAECLGPFLRRMHGATLRILESSRDQVLSRLFRDRTNAGTLRLP